MSHLTQNVIERYFPVVMKGVEAWPREVEVERFKGFKQSTFVARCRDTLKAVREQPSEFDLSTKQIQALQELKIKATLTGIAIGPGTKYTPVHSKESQPRVVEREGLTPKELHAIGVLVESGLLDSYTFTQTPLATIRQHLDYLTIIETPEGVIIYE